jgi:hypothetical protein
MSEYDKNTWTTEGESILSENNLVAIKKHLESVGSIAVEHWHFYGSRAPTRLVFDDFDDFNEYLQRNVQPGDAIDVYPFPHHPSKTVARGKYPDAEGRVPKGGAY